MPRGPINVPQYSDSEWRAAQFGSVMDAVHGWRRRRQSKRKEEAQQRLKIFLQSAENFTPDDFARFASHAKQLFVEAGIPEAYEHAYETTWRAKTRGWAEEELLRKQKLGRRAASEKLLSGADQLREMGKIDVGLGVPTWGPSMPQVNREELTNPQAFEEQLRRMDPSAAARAVAGMEERGLTIPEEEERKIPAFARWLEETFEGDELVEAQRIYAKIESPQAVRDQLAGRRTRPERPVMAQKSARQYVSTIMNEVALDLGLAVKRTTKKGKEKLVWKQGVQRLSPTSMAVLTQAAMYGQPVDVAVADLLREENAGYVADRGSAVLRQRLLSILKQSGAVDGGVLSDAGRRMLEEFDSADDKSAYMQRLTEGMQGGGTAAPAAAPSPAAAPPMQEEVAELVAQPSAAGTAAPPAGPMTVGQALEDLLRNEPGLTWEQAKRRLVMAGHDPSKVQQLGPLFSIVKSQLSLPSIDIQKATPEEVARYRAMAGEER